MYIFGPCPRGADFFLFAFGAHTSSDYYTGSERHSEAMKIVGRKSMRCVLAALGLLVVSLALITPKVK